MSRAPPNGEHADKADSDSFVIYADFNCPFCYALNERVIALELENRVSFHNVQHAPGVSSNQTGFETLSKLTTDVAEVCRRAPSTYINIPLFRPNSGPASLMLSSVSRHDPANANRLRNRIFQTLWVDGKDISDSKVLTALAQDLNIEVPQESAEDIDELEKWQLAWDSNKAFERAIPIIISAQGETVVGFPLEPEVDGFLKTGSLISDQVLHGSTELQHRQWILVLDNEVASLQMIIQQMHDSRVEVVADIDSMMTLVREQGMPDLVIVNMALIPAFNSTDWWRDTTKLDVESEIPVVFVSDIKTTEEEVSAFEAGAVEFVAKPFHPKILKARLNTHLQARISQQQLSNIARIDSLTSICNRREFDMRLLTEWRRSARAGLQLALIMIDIDKFKEYNDHYGHLKGDDCLALVAQTLKACNHRATDTIARYGGEEFVALLPESDLAGALEVAQQYLKAIQSVTIPHAASKIDPYITISIGVAAIHPTTGRSMTLLIEQADIALYQAKNNGRNQVCSFEDEI